MASLMGTEAQRGDAPGRAAHVEEEGRESGPGRCVCQAGPDCHPQVAGVGHHSFWAPVSCPGHRLRLC